MNDIVLPRNMEPLLTVDIFFSSRQDSPHCYSHKSSASPRSGQLYVQNLDKEPGDSSFSFGQVREFLSSLTTKAADVSRMLWHSAYICGLGGERVEPMYLVQHFLLTVCISIEPFILYFLCYHIIDKLNVLFIL